MYVCECRPLNRHSPAIGTTFTTEGPQLRCKIQRQHDTPATGVENSKHAPFSRVIHSKVEFEINKDSTQSTDSSRYREGCAQLRAGGTRDGGQLLLESIAKHTICLQTQ